MAHMQNSISRESCLTFKGWIATIIYIILCLPAEFKKGCKCFWCVFRVPSSPHLGKFVSCHALPTMDIILCTTLFFFSSFIEKINYIIQFIHLKCVIQCVSITINFTTFLLPPKASLLPLTVTSILSSCQQPLLYFLSLCKFPIFEHFTGFGPL